MISYLISYLISYILWSLFIYHSQWYICCSILWKWKNKIFHIKQKGPILCGKFYLLFKYLWHLIVCCFIKTLDNSYCMSQDQLDYTLVTNNPKSWWRIGAKLLCLPHSTLPVSWSSHCNIILTVEPRLMKSPLLQNIASCCIKRKRQGKFALYFLKASVPKWHTSFIFISHFPEQVALPYLTSKGKERALLPCAQKEYHPPGKQP